MFLGTGAFLAGCARPEAGEQLRTRLTPLAQIPDLLEAGAVVQASHAYALATLLRARGV